MALEKERSQKETQGEDGKKSSSRYWTQEEHERFLEGLKLYGHKEIKAISRHVRTRNATQVWMKSQVCENVRVCVGLFALLGPPSVRISSSALTSE